MPISRKDVFLCGNHTALTDPREEPMSAVSAIGLTPGEVSPDVVSTFFRYGYPADDSR